MTEVEGQHRLTGVPRDVIVKNLQAVEAALSVISGKWKIMIVGHLHDGPHRFSELRKFMPLISQQSLVCQLRELERDGVVKRRSYVEIPPRVEYSLTELGSKISPMMLPLMIWGYEIMDARYDRLQSLVEAELPQGALPHSDRPSDSNGNPLEGGGEVLVLDQKSGMSSGMS